MLSSGLLFDLLLLGFSSAFARDDFLASHHYYSPGTVSVRFHEGRAQECDEEHPCPAGFQCMYSHFVPGIKACYSNVRDPRSRPGRCPLPTTPLTMSLSISADTRGNFPKELLLPLRGQQMQARHGQSLQNQMCGSPCYFDQDCAPYEKCCYSIFCETSGRSCIAAIAIDPKPKVTILLEGEDRGISEQGRIQKGSVALVQSNGKNVLFDTGASVQKISLIKALRERAGLELSDIHMVLISHGHPDHNANAGLFPDTDTNFNSFLMRGTKMYPNAFSLEKRKPRYFIQNDPNLELVQTPGHTHQDTSLLVYNVPGAGTVALVGDLVLDDNDWDKFQSVSMDRSLQHENRRRVFCASNWILPGHGKIFRVTDEMKQQAGGCEGVHRNAGRPMLVKDPVYQVTGWSASPLDMAFLEPLQNQQQSLSQQLNLQNQQQLPPLEQNFVPSRNSQQQQQQNLEALQSMAFSPQVNPQPSKVATLNFPGAEQGFVFSNGMSASKQPSFSLQQQFAGRNNMASASQRGENLLGGRPLPPLDRGAVIGNSNGNGNFNNGNNNEFASKALFLELNKNSANRVPIPFPAASRQSQLQLKSLEQPNQGQSQFAGLDGGAKQFISFQDHRDAAAAISAGSATNGASATAKTQAFTFPVKGLMETLHGGAWQGPIIDNDKSKQLLADKLFHQ